MRNVRESKIFKKYKTVLTKPNRDRIAEFVRLNGLAAATRTRLEPLYALVRQRNQEMAA